MTRGCAGALVAIALVAGLALRLARLDVRPMHHDEANQAVKFGALLERGEYRYDFHDHHGPTLYYLSLPAAWMRGQHTLASLDESTLRGVTAVFGAATILLLPWLAAGIGRTAVASGALLMALSPAMVFYSRMFIQESLFACFTLAFVIAVGRALPGTVPQNGTVPGSGTVPENGTVLDIGTVPAGAAVLAGVAAGLAIATKETSVIVLPAALAACGIAWWSLGPGRRDLAPRVRRSMPRALASLGAALAVAALFYSSFFTAPGAVLEPLRGATTYLDRGIEPASHAHPWYYYLRLLAFSSSGGLTWSEGLIVALALAGAASAWRRPDPSRPEQAFWARYLTCYVMLAAAIFSAIPYKTPWNLLPFHAGAIVLAGVGVSALLRAAPSRMLRALLAAGLLLASVQLGWQAWRASVTYAADPRNPYVYAQTVPDAVRMAARIRDLSALHPDGVKMQVSVVAPPYEQWPLPWYLRAMPYVGYWTSPGDPLALQAPVIVASMDHAAALDAALGDRYVSEYFGLRPEVLLALYVERGLWERFLAKVTSQSASADPPWGRTSVLPHARSAEALRLSSQACPARCGIAPAVALWRASVP